MTLSSAEPRTLWADKVLVDGRAEGRILKLRAPISFWGGVDPVTARVIDARHPDRGVSIEGRILCLPGMIGSSSAAPRSARLGAKRGSIRELVSRF